jgi:UDPglucose 6-dehydrogenase
VERSTFPDCTFVIVPSPSDPDGSFSNKFVVQAVEDYCEKFLESDIESAILVIVSTVMPGTMEGEIIPLINSKLASKANRLKLFYSPEFIALGSVIRNLQYPDVVLIGAESRNSGTALEDILTKTVKNTPEFICMDFVNAEIAKISVNAFVTMKISFANQLSEICQLFPSGDADDVLNAIGKDLRIGNSYLQSAPAFGGPCFPRDNRAFSKMASNLGVDASLSKGTDQINLRQADRLLKQFRAAGSTWKNVLVLGISYKPGTRVVEESPSLKFLEYLALEELVQKISLFDPLFVDLNAQNGLSFPKKVAILDEKDLQIAINEVDVIYLFNNSPEFSELPQHVNNVDTVLIDLWGSWRKYESQFKGRYYRLGKSAKDSRGSR